MPDDEVPVITGSADIRLTDAELVELVATLDHEGDDDGPGPCSDAA